MADLFDDLKSRVPKDIYLNFFSVLDHMTAQDHDLTSNEFFWAFDLIIIMKKIDSLQIKWKLKTRVFWCDGQLKGVYGYNQSINLINLSLMI